MAMGTVKGGVTMIRSTTTSAPVFGLILQGCAMNDEALSTLMVDPGRYQYHRCPELTRAGTEVATRLKELEILMNRSGEGVWKWGSECRGL